MRYGHYLEELQAIAYHFEIEDLIDAVTEFPTLHHEIDQREQNVQWHNQLGQVLRGRQSKYHQASLVDDLDDILKEGSLGHFRDPSEFQEDDCESGESKVGGDTDSKGVGKDWDDANQRCNGHLGAVQSACEEEIRSFIFNFVSDELLVFLFLLGLRSIEVDCDFFLILALGSLLDFPVELLGNMS